MRLDNGDWKYESVHMNGVTVDIGFIVKDSFYYGPENGFTSEQWSALQEKLYQPDLHKSGSFVLSADINGKEEELFAYYKDLKAKVLARGKSLENSTEFWNRPVIYAPDSFNLSFCWHDRFREGKSLLRALLADDDGEVFSDIDQGWQLDIYRHDGMLYALQGDPDTGTVHYNVKFEHAPIKDQAAQLLPRIEKLIADLTAQLGTDYWT